MQVNEIKKHIDIMVDNMMSSVNDANMRFDEKQKFLTWLSLTYAADLIRFEEYDEIKQYGLFRIDKEFDNWVRLEKLFR